jgi:hypothetical protein
MSDDRTAAEIARAHVVRRPPCRCARRHYRDSYPEFCSEEYAAMDPSDQLLLSEVRAGVVRHRADAEAIRSDPRPYSADDGNPIDQWDNH